MRPPQVDLPLTEQKCMPRGHCAQATTCARWLAKAAPGLAVGDFSGSQHGVFIQGHCAFYLPAAEHRRKPAAQQPTVHEAPGWLR